MIYSRAFWERRADGAAPRSGAPPRKMRVTCRSRGYHCSTFAAWGKSVTSQEQPARRVPDAAEEPFRPPPGPGHRAPNHSNNPDFCGGSGAAAGPPSSIPPGQKRRDRVPPASLRVSAPNKVSRPSRRRQQSNASPSIRPTAPAGQPAGAADACKQDAGSRTAGPGSPLEQPRAHSAHQTGRRQDGNPPCLRRRRSPAATPVPAAPSPRPEAAPQSPDFRPSGRCPRTRGRDAATCALSACTRGRRCVDICSRPNSDRNRRFS